MNDLVEIQQFISNIPSVEKIASASQILAVNSNNILRKEMENSDTENLTTVVELSEVLEPVNDENKRNNNKNGSSSDSESGSEAEAGTEKGQGENGPPRHINITA